MKRLIAILLALTLCLSLAACGDDDTDDDDDREDDAATEAPAAEDDEEAADETETPTASTVASSDEPQYGGTVTLYRDLFINNLDPSQSSYNSSTLYYETLWVIDWGLNDPDTFAFDSDYLAPEYMTGQIAKDYTYDLDAGTVTVEIRDDIYFQTKEDSTYDIYGGRLLTAEDVKYSYDRILGTGSGFTEPYECDVDWVSQLNMIESIDVEDDFTVVFNLAEDSRTETCVADFLIVQVNIAGPEWDELTEEQRGDWRYVAGTGPFILDEYVLDSYMHFVRNDNYYDYDLRYPENRLPYLDGVTIQVVTDTSNLLAQFISGDLDWISSGGGGNVLGDSEMAQLRSTLSTDQYHEFVGSNNTIGIGLKQTHEALADINVRKAMQMTINSAEIHYNYYGYETDIQHMGLFFPSTDYSTVDDWSDELYAVYDEYDLEGAKALLAETDYADGFTFEVVIFPNVDTELFQLAASYLALLNITMDINVVSTPQEMEQLGESPDNTVSMFKNGGRMDMQTVYTQLTSEGGHDSIYHNDEYFDGLIADMIAADTMEERVSLGREADEYFASQHWVLMLGGAIQTNDFINSRVCGYTGESITINYNARTVLARVWVNDAN